jgi:hypothetical protein
MTLLHDRADARNSEVTPTFTVVSTAAHDRAWWTVEVARTGTDWRSLTAAVLEVLASAGIIRLEQSTFELACEQANRKRQPHPSRQEVAMGAPATTVEALVFSLRRGVNELTQPDTERRLAALDAHQLKEACRRVQAFHPKIAKQWLADDVERLISAWKNSHG